MRHLKANRKLVIILGVLGIAIISIFLYVNSDSYKAYRYKIESKKYDEYIINVRNKMTHIDEDLSMIHQGMSEKEVLKLIGEPYFKREFKSSKLWTYIRHSIYFYEGEVQAVTNLE